MRLNHLPPKQVQVFWGEFRLIFTTVKLCPDQWWIMLAAVMSYYGLF